MNLHILPDNIYAMKFIEFVLKHFSNQNHIFLILTSFEKAKYIEIIEDSTILVLHIESLKQKIKYLNDIKLNEFVSMAKNIYIHSLNSFSAFIVFRYAKPDQALIWIPWGFDIYEYIPNLELFDEDTKIIAKTSLPKDSKVLKNIKDKMFLRYIRAKVIARIIFIAIDFKPEFDLIKENFYSKAEYKSFHYPNPINFISLDKAQINKFQPNTDTNLNSKKPKMIQVGNSGDPNNNHISVFKLLVGIKQQNFSILCPLSYGEPDYIRRIVEIGKNYFGNRFIPILKFLPPEEYLNLINQVDVAIFNHYRQQGKGNIVPLIYLGKKIYIREKVTTYIAYKTMGIKIESTDMLFESTLQDILIPYRSEEKEMNRKIIFQMYNEEEDLKKMHEMFSK